MPDKAKEDMKATDLPVALYLNQRVTFDLLATLEDGFAHLTTVQESSSDTRTSDLQGEAGLGISNRFAFLGVRFGAKASGGSERTSVGTTTQELVHTPTSLFAKLRQQLLNRDLVRPIADDAGSFDAVEPGDFVEFQATLRRSPLVALLSSFSELISMAGAFGHGGTTPAAPQGARHQGGGKKGTSEWQLAQRQVDAMLKALTAAGSQDLVAQCGRLRFVLTAEEAYFIDKTMNDVIDGTFRVFGKVTRVVPVGEEPGISLLRKTALGNFGQAVEDQFGSAFRDLADVGFTGQAVETEIPPPTIQVIPIAIFA